MDPLGLNEQNNKIQVPHPQEALQDTLLPRGKSWFDLITRISSLFGRLVQSFACVRDNVPLLYCSGIFRSGSPRLPRMVNHLRPLLSLLPLPQLLRRRLRIGRNQCSCSTAVAAQRRTNEHPHEMALKNRQVMDFLLPVRLPVAGHAICACVLLPHMNVCDTFHSTDQH